MKPPRSLARIYFFSAKYSNACKIAQLKLVVGKEAQVVFGKKGSKGNIAKSKIRSIANSAYISASKCAGVGAFVTLRKPRMVE